MLTMEVRLVVIEDLRLVLLKEPIVPMREVKLVRAVRAPPAGTILSNILPLLKGIHV